MFPSVIVAITAALKRQYFLKEKFCWLTYDTWAIWTLLGPSLILICISAVLLSMALYTSFKMERSLAGVSKFQRIGKLLFLLIPVIGITWSFSLLAVNEKKIVYQYVLTGFNGLLGSLAFMSYCSLRFGFKETITPKKKPKHSMRSSTSTGRDNKCLESSMVSLSVINEPTFHSKTNF